MDIDRAIQIADIELKRLEGEARRLASIATWESAAPQYKEKAKADLAGVRDRLMEVRRRIQELHERQ